MGLYDVPAGIKPVTGILIDPQLYVSEIPAGETTVGVTAIHRWNLGEGYCVGIHGADIRGSTLGNSTTVESSSWFWRLFLDASVLPITNELVGGYEPGDSSIALETQEQITGDGTGDINARNWHQVFTHGGPVLTVQPALSLAFINAAATRALSMRSNLWYSIYEVTDAQFLRIAGVSLSRG